MKARQGDEVATEGHRLRVFESRLPEPKEQASSATRRLDVLGAAFRRAASADAATVGAAPRHSAMVSFESIDQQVLELTSPRTRHVVCDEASYRRLTEVSRAISVQIERSASPSQTRTTQKKHPATG